MNISYPDQNFRVFQSYSTCGYVFGINLQPEYPTKDQIEMNRNYLIAASLFLAFNLQAQEYNFSRSTRNYTQLSTTNRFPLDSFSSLDTMFKTSFRIDYFKRLMGDSVLFDGSLLYLTEAGLPSTLNDEISPMEADIRPRSNGTAYIAHTTEGNAGNRIFKIEYHNMGFNDDTTHNDSASYQIWFYENGVIEFLYGPSSVRNSASWYDGETGPAVYMGSWDTINETVIGLSGNPNNPTLYDKWDDYAALSSMPAPNTVYTFTPAFTGNVHKPAAKQFHIADQGNQTFRIIGTQGQTNWTVYDALGRTVQKGSGSAFILEQRSGIYRIAVQDDMRREVHGIVVH
jgi:hypothetical protein